MQVKLEKPGAGLPKLEQKMLKFFFKKLTKIKGKEHFERLYRREAANITKLVSGLDSVQGSERRLIKRVVGMEDSSRNWSVYMTLEHLNMVNTGLSKLVEKLTSTTNRSADVSELTEVKIENVKPDEGANETSVAGFSKANNAVMLSISSISELRSNRKHAHPWFGLLDGFEWFALMAIHMGVHRKQIERILEN